jgi:transcriptional regulator GlxA family with amidase domain
MRTKREIAVVLYEDMVALEATGAVAVFFAANEQSACADYRLKFISARGGLVRGEGDVFLQSERVAPNDEFHTLLVPGTRKVESLLADEATIDLVRRAAGRARRVVSICTGAFALAACGLLDGRRATTHWQQFDALASRFPNVRLDRESLLVRDGAYWTAGCATTGLDLALAMVDADHGEDLAVKVAGDLMLYVRRPNGDNQGLGIPLRMQSVENVALERVRHAILERPDRAWTVQQLADKARLSSRQLLRLFRQELDMSPRDFIRCVALEHAQFLLHGSECHIGEVARQCGFGSAAAFSRCFKARNGLTPSMYRFKHRGR